VNPGERKDCEACGTAMIGALTVKGKVAPIEVATHDDGNVWLGRRAPGDLHDPGGRVVVCATLAGPLLEKAREVGIALHHNHFATCPQRDRFKRD
jgi:hypothetical protein